MLPWGCMLEDAWVEQPFPNFLLPLTEDFHGQKIDALKA